MATAAVKLITARLSLLLRTACLLRCRTRHADLMQLAREIFLLIVQAAWRTCADPFHDRLHIYAEPDWVLHRSYAPFFSHLEQDSQLQQPLGLPRARIRGFLSIG